MRVSRLLSRRENRFCPHLQAVSGFGSLASEFDPGRGTFADATARLVVRPVGRVSGALRSATAE